MKLRKNQAGFSAVEVLLVLIFLAIVAFAGYYVYHAQKTSNKTDATSNSQATKTQATKKHAPSLDDAKAKALTVANEMLSPNPSAASPFTAANFTAAFLKTVTDGTAFPDGQFCGVSASDMNASLTVSNALMTNAGAVVTIAASSTTGPNLLLTQSDGHWLIANWNCQGIGG